MFSEKYPSLAWWITDNEGEIHLGSADEYDDTLLRIIDEIGLAYEDEDSDSLDEALEKAERWAAEEIENF